MTVVANADNRSSGGPRVVHVSADYPDFIRPDKTSAIASLVALADAAFEQSVISLNRAPAGMRFLAQVARAPLYPRLRVETLAPTGQSTAVSYHAPGRGIYHFAMQRRLGEWLADRLAGGALPALIVGHKLSFEGIAVAHAARLLGVPYALTIQGDSDLKVLDHRPDLRSAIAAVFHGAAAVMAFAPWALTCVEAHCGKRSGPSLILPCAVASNRVIAPQPDGESLISVFHLKSWRRKGLDRMARAINRTNARLAVVGGGTDAVRAEADEVVHRFGRGRVDLEGALPGSEIPARINRAIGYVMPSLRESFGLVFIESLFAGTPIVYPAGWAVDGLLDGLPFAIPVATRSIDSIADGMARLVRDEPRLKSALAEWQGSGALDRFSRETISQRYIDFLATAVASPPAAPA